MSRIRSSLTLWALTPASSLFAVSVIAASKVAARAMHVAARDRFMNMLPDAGERCANDSSAA